MGQEKPLKLKRDEARALAIAAQGLAEPAGRALTGKSVLRAVERLGVLQVDTITTVERSQYLVLWSRLGAYDEALLDTLIYPRRALFECMAPVALIAPMRNYRYYRPRMLHSRPETQSWHQDWFAQNPDAMRETLETVRARGPMASADFERPPNMQRTGPWDWHGPKPSRRALELLWNAGDLMVHSRRGGQKLYDVRERVLAEAFGSQIPDDAALPSTEERLEFFARHAVEALGVIQPAWLWEYHAVRPEIMKGGNRKGAALAMLERLAAEGVVLPAAIEGVPGQTFVAASLLTQLRRYRRRTLPLRTTFLSPFDSLIWDRARTRALFNFDVCFEAYVPAHKRKYGYYCLSILHDGRLVGRIDPKMDRAARTLRVRAAYLEPDEGVTDALLDGVAKALRDLARFLGAARVEVGLAGHPLFGPALGEHLER